MRRRIGVCFVCTGNICRSPTAEGVMRSMVERAGFGSAFHIDSAGTIGYHAGELPDARARRVASAQGYSLTHRARLLLSEDYTRFDYLLAMDTGHLGVLRSRAPASSTARVALFRSFDPEAAANSEVPDPYYGDDGGFEDVLSMSVRACKGLLSHIEKQHELQP